MEQYTHYKHDWQIPQLERVDGGEFRTYKCPNGKSYPSVTSVLGYGPKPGLDEWRTRVGEDQAKKISVQAAGRGTAIHAYMEDLLNNKPVKVGNPFYADMFSQMKTLIRGHLDNVYLQEAQLYSEYLEMAGTLDCLAAWDNRLSIIDFKTSRAHKPKEWIDSYFMQCAAYAIMVEERFQKPVSQLVILIACEEEAQGQVFVENRDNWTKKLMKQRKTFKEGTGL